MSETDSIDVLVRHNRRALALIIGSARHLSKPALYTHFGLGIGTFRDSVVLALTTMALWTDLLNGEPLRRYLVVTDSEGRLLASEVRSVSAMLKMLESVADEFEAAIAKARPVFHERRVWTLADGSTRESTVMEGVLHALDLCAYRRTRSVMALKCAGSGEMPVGLDILAWTSRTNQEPHPP